MSNPSLSQSSFPTLIGIHGNAGTGKDTIAKYLHSTRPNTWAEAFADPLKKACSEMFGIPLDVFYDPQKKAEYIIYWDKTPREILQYFGTEIARHYDHDFWVRRMALELTGRSNSGVEYTAEDTVIITDVRFQNEADYIQSSGGYIIHLTRPGYCGKVGIKDHESEKAELDFWNFSQGDRYYAIDNTGTLDDLFAKVDEAVSYFKLYQQSTNTTQNLFNANF